MNLRKTFYKNNKIWWLLYIIFWSVNGGLSLAMSVILQQITDAAAEKNMQLLIKMCGVCGIGIVVIMLISVAQYYTEAKFLKRAMLQYKNEIFSNLLKKNRRSFSNENTSVYISAITNDATSIEANYLQGTVKLISYIIAFVATLVLMLWYSPLLTFAAIGLTLIPIVISILTGNKLAVVEQEVSKGNADFVGTIKDMLSGFSVIKSFRAEHEIDKIYQKDNEKLESTKFHKNMTTGKIGLLSETGMLISQIGVFLIGGFLVIEEKGITVGVLIAFINMLSALITPINAIPQFYAGRKAAAGLIDKMETVLMENVTESTGAAIEMLEEAITVKDVSFGYTEEVDVLKNVSVRLKAKKSYALVGGSGSGKSTLLDLIMGNFGNYRGEVAFDGKELKEIQIESLYDLISVVQQNVFIFDSTIRENITMFKEFPDAQVQRAIELSGLKRLIVEKGEAYL
ncbi:MAG: ABC transporter ATP-binding protein, partial [Lachnospiraceae bacterium]|nr:ABC transporter ATP-binding protein [Lachnospiraceae bacterium]